MGYMDNSGLFIKIGPEVAVPEAAGEYNNLGALREVEVIIPDLTKITASDVIITGTDNFFFPKGVKIEKVTVITDVAATGASSTMNIGFMATDRTTVSDTSAILNALPLASMTIGNEATIVKGGTGAGTQLGTGVATTGVFQLCAKFGTAVFTAGAIRVRISFYRP